MGCPGSPTRRHDGPIPTGEAGATVVPVPVLARGARVRARVEGDEEGRIRHAIYIEPIS